MNQNQLIYHPEQGNFKIAEAYFRAGFNLVPLRVDGSRGARIKYSRYHREPQSWREISRWFWGTSKPSGIALICGAMSGNLEVFDFDYEAKETFRPWASLVSRKFPGLIQQLPIVKTPSGGWHVYTRSDCGKPSRVLAATEEHKVIIETRAAGSIIVAPGSPPNTHKRGLPYRLVSGDIFRTPKLSLEQRTCLIEAAESFNRFVKPPKAVQRRPKPKAIKNGNERPGDRFERLASWEEILEPAGWSIVREQGNVVYWQKPGGKHDEHHATTGYGSADCLFIFSTAVSEFVAQEPYRKFAAYAILHHGGDYSKAAAAISHNPKYK